MAGRRSTLQSGRLVEAEQHAVKARAASGGGSAHLDAGALIGTDLAHLVADLAGLAVLLALRKARSAR